MKSIFQTIKRLILMVLTLGIFVAGAFFADSPAGQKAIEVMTGIQEVLEEPVGTEEALEVEDTTEEEAE